MTVEKKVRGSDPKAKRSSVKSAGTSGFSDEHNFQQLIEISPVATVVYDADCNVTFSNQAFADMLGLKLEEVTNKPLTELFSVRGSDASEEVFVPTEGNNEYEIVTPDGEQFWGLVSTWNTSGKCTQKATRKPAKPSVKKPSSKITQIINIDAQQKAHSDLTYRESIWRNAISASQLGVWDYNALTDERFYSDYWKHIRGVPMDEEAKGDIKSWESRIHPDDLEGVRDNVRRQNSGEMKLFSYEYRERRRDGQWVWILSRGRAVEWAEDGTPIRLTGTDSDITLRKDEERRRMDHMVEVHLNHVKELESVNRETKTAHRIAKAMSLLDPLTELANRYAFAEQVRKKLKAKGKTPFAVIMINLDKFRTINDEHGHLAGDLVICEMATRLRRTVTVKDMVARVSGDEYGIILNEINDLDIEHRVKMIATNIIDELKEPITLGDYDVEISASIGIAMYPEHGNSVENLFRAADVAMHDVKSGEEGGTWEIFSPTVDIEMVSSGELEELTRIAVENEDIHPFFQPTVDLKTGEVVGFKILPRWHHPERGFISPANFIPIIEQAGLRIQFSKSILRKTCKICQSWPEHIGLGLKIAAEGIVDPRVPDGVKEILSEFGIAPNRLQIAVTETALATGGEAAKEVVEALRSNGVRILLDEFGSGKTGLNYLHEFHFDGVRIDRSFIGAMRRSDSSEKIVRSMISLANELGLYSIAEGIEDVDTHMYVQHTGGTYGQGYFYGKPVPFDEATAMLEQTDGVLALAG